MSDRDLLERAARAAGYPFYWRGLQKTLPSIFVGRDQQWWNPLTDDGDALRLAAALNMTIDFTQIGCVVWFEKIVHGAPYRTFIDQSAMAHGGDKMAAMRRAIVRAAAAMHPDTESGECGR